MAGVPTSADLGCADESGEEEIFFGPLTDKELKLARRLVKRRTELYLPAFKASRPSLAEFRLNHNSLFGTEDDCLSKSNDGPVDSLEVKPYASPCKVLDPEEPFRNGQSAVRDSSCSTSTTYYSAVSEVDHLVANLEDTLNDVDGISTGSVTYYSAAFEAEQLDACREDSLNDVDQYSLGSRIEQANDSLVIHSKRRSSVRLRDSIVRPRLLFEKEDSGACEVVSESSFEQDSYSVPESELEKQMELLDVKDVKADALSVNGSQDAELDLHSGNSPNNNIVAKGSFFGICDQPEHAVDGYMGVGAFALSPNLSVEVHSRLSDDSDSVLPAPPTSPEISSKSILSEESDLTPEQSRAFEDEFMPFKISPAALSKNEHTEVGKNDGSLRSDAVSGGGDTLKRESKFVTLTFSPAKSFMSVLNFKKLLTSPLVTSCIARSNVSAKGESFTENPTAPEQSASANVDGSSVHQGLKEPMALVETGGDGLVDLKNIALPEPDYHHMPSHSLVRNECCEENDNSAPMSQCTVMSPVLVCRPAEPLEKSATLSPTPANNSAEAQSRCPMVEHATSYCQSEEIVIDAIDQGCQTSFVGYTGTAPAIEADASACGETPFSEGQEPTRCTPSANQQAGRIPMYRTATGLPRRVPTFKTPTKPPLRVPTPCGTSAVKRNITPKASPLLSRTPTEDGTRLVPGIKSRYNYIISPVAQYIKDSSVPPLISNNRPIDSRSTKLRSTPSTRIPVPNSSSKKLPLMAVSAAHKRFLVPSAKSPKKHLPVPKAKSKLNFVYNASEDTKENSSIEDSVYEELKITIKEVHEIGNKKLKEDILDYVKTRKAMIVNAIKENNRSGGSGQNGDAVPCLSYKGASSLATRQVDLLTKLHTVKNANVVACSPVQPTILKHTGERKVLHWANGLVSEVDSLSSPLHPKIIAPAIFMKNAHKTSSGSSYGSTSTVDVSIVEIINPVRTNTLAKK